MYQIFITHNSVPSPDRLHLGHMVSTSASDRVDHTSLCPRVEVDRLEQSLYYVLCTYVFSERERERENEDVKNVVCVSYFVGLSYNLYDGKKKPVSYYTILI